MDLIVQVQSHEALEAALAAGVAVTVELPRDANESWWAEATAWQADCRTRGLPFYIQWDQLVVETELPQARETLAAVAALGPDALVLRDLGLCREARRSHPGLPLHAAGSCGYHNSPGLSLAAALGFSRVELAGPLPLKDLALLERQTTLPLTLALPQPCPGFGHLCLLEDYLGRDCSACCHPKGWQTQPAAGLLAALELLPGLPQLGVAAVRLAGVFSRGKTLSRIIELCHLVADASPAARPRMLDAAREVLAAFGEEFRLEFAPPEAAAEPSHGPGSGRRPSEPPRASSRSGLVWLEARDYAEAIVLAPAWREPLLLQLTPENYHAFLAQYRHWDRRRLIWRLPPVLPESTLSFYRQAIATLKEGGFSRFIAGDWGGVALVREAGGEIYGEQTLGVRNSLALATARELAVSKVCLPPGRGPQDWQELVQAAPRGSFWGYLYHLPVLAACPRGAGDLAAPDAEKLRWLTNGDLTVLIPEVPEHFEACRGWFEQKWVAPLVVSLVYSGLAWGRVPELARPPRPEPRPRTQLRPRPQPRGKAGPRRRPERPGGQESPARPHPRRRRQP
jgi:collagenase-like PrtC family protease